MPHEPQLQPGRAEARLAPGGALDPLDSGDYLDRVELAARLLALKQPSPDPLGLIERAASQVAARTSGPRHGDEVITMISALIRVSGEASSGEVAGRERAATLRFGALLAAELDAPVMTALRGLLRSGAFERPLPLAAVRRVRRLCRGGEAIGGAMAELGSLALAAWETLLETLARSLVFEGEAQLRVDVEQLGLPSAERHAAVRAALERGARSPAPPERPLGPSTPDATMGAEESEWPQPERAPLAAGHKVGRFTLLTRLGVGAMGVVYSAYDPELDRKIAVKLLRAPEGKHSARGQARLMREAQAMARLNHPNVAVVHDVGAQDRDVFVAMEFVRGDTLQEWRARHPRKWSEILEVYVQAGRGLAAAHAVGLVHRDFKPSNAMIGDDGRVRVLDFGLCHAETVPDAPADSADESAASRQERVTGNEEMVGTPAYMAPEQFQSGAVGPASDQFSFCVALYEALYERLPFAGDTVFELAYAVTHSEPRPAPRGSGVPIWLHAALLRGMKADPAARFPSMDALLRALDRRRSRGRGRVVVAAVAVVVAGGVGFLSASGRSPAADPCSGGAAAVAEVWNAERAAAGRRAFTAAGPAVVAEIWPRVLDGLDDYAARWTHLHRASCEAHLRGERSTELLDRGMVCLAQRRHALAEAARVLGEADREVAVRALAVVGDLPELERCGDVEVLAAGVPPPTDLKLRAGIEEQRPRLARVRTLDRAGRQAAAIDLADDVLRAAEQLGDRALLAEALLQRSYLAIHGSGLAPEQETQLTRAYLTALGGGLDELVTEALALRMYLRGRSQDGVDQALEDLAVARETMLRLPAPGRVRGLVLNNAGTMYMALGKPAQAEQMFREALAARESALGVDHVEVAYTLVNLALVSAAEQERAGLMHRALAIFDRQLGEAHPQTIEVRLAASLRVEDPVAARTLLAPGCAALDRFTAEDHEARARCLGQLAHHVEEAGDPAARAMWVAVAELLGGPMLRVNDGEIASLRGRAALATGSHAEAIDDLRAARAAAGDQGEWWQQRHRAELDLLLGQHLLAQDRPAEARRPLRAAVDGYTAAAATAAGDVLQQQRLALARVLLGGTSLRLAADGEARAAAITLFNDAERWYRAAGTGYQWRLAWVEAARSGAAAP